MPEFEKRDLWISVGQEGIQRRAPNRLRLPFATSDPAIHVAAAQMQSTWQRRTASPSRNGWEHKGYRSAMPAIQGSGRSHLEPERRTQRAFQNSWLPRGNQQTRDPSTYPRRSMAPCAAQPGHNTEFRAEPQHTQPHKNREDCAGYKALKHHASHQAGRETPNSYPHWRKPLPQGPGLLCLDRPNPQHTACRPAETLCPVTPHHEYRSFAALYLAC